MNILFAASEVAPFIKTGGLADVAGALPKMLADMGHDVKVILPLYEGVAQEWRDQMEFREHFNVRVAWRNPYCGIFEYRADNISYYFVDNEYYFKRTQVYGHYDDGERFAFFSRAVLALPAHIDWHPDIIHANDWQTALVPVYLLEAREQVWQLRGTRSVFTIHNIEYQGRYGSQVLEDLLGLNKGYLNEHMLAYHGDVNLMKGALYAADYVTTVSPSYAGELQYPFYAHGLEGVIAHNGSKMRGVLNGIDAKLFNPADDKGLAAPFTADDLTGKAACKKALQNLLGLREDPNVPIVACISRLVKHKGFDLVADSIHDIMNMNVQMVVLGTGDWNFEEAFRHAEAQYPGRFAARIQYSAALSTAIYGGADLFLMPSVSEPCGLSQMIAMRYGTVPVVRETGGLKDTVIPRGLPGERGFTFADINERDMVWVLGEAVGLYHEDKDAWARLQKNGMTNDFSWENPAREYEDIYYGITSIPRPIEPAPEEAPAPAQEQPVKKASAKKSPPAEEISAEPAPVAEPETKAEPAAEPAPAVEPAAPAEPAAETPKAKPEPAKKEKAPAKAKKEKAPAKAEKEKTPSKAKAEKAATKKAAKEPAKKGTEKAPKAEPVKTAAPAEPAPAKGPDAKKPKP